MKRATDKRSEAELRRLTEDAVAEACGLPKPGHWFCADHVEAVGDPPERLQVRATLHFLEVGSPFCCGEPGCHLGLADDAALRAVGEHLRRAMGLRCAVDVEFYGGIGVCYHAGVVFASD